VWFKVDDKFHDHPKVRDPDLAALGLWTLSGSWAGENLTDGFVPEFVARRWTTPARLRKHAAWLVDRGLWEPAEKGRETGWIFHDWTDQNPTEEETTTDLGRLRWQRKNALKKDRQLREQVVARDRGMCRYCGIRVNWKDRRGTAGGTYDHVDPDGENTLENVVVACRRCNGIKKDRTPDEALMPLLPVPAPYAQDLAPDLDRSQNGSGSDQEPPTRGGAEPGRSRVGPGSHLAPVRGAS
jgi:5-methylcytosine-specific restriction endonuclease McrA